MDCLNLTKDRIEFYETRTMEGIIRSTKYCYEQSRGKPDYQKTWKDKKNEKYDQRKKGFKPSNFRNQQKQPFQVEKQPTRVVGENPRDPQKIRGPLQCWRCGGPHMHKNYPLENGYLR